MEQDSSKKPVFSDVHIFYAIAKESYESMLKHMEAGIRPKKNGEPGCIKTPDPERKSFKAALITIVFCGVFLEALLHLLIVDKKGVEEFKKVDKKESYEGKLSLLECKDTEIKKSYKLLREVRRRIVHEKAHTDKDYLEISPDEIHVFQAQGEAEKAIILIDKVIAYFNLTIGR